MALFKYADDMALVAHMADPDAPTRYQGVVNNLAQTFAQLSLKLNVSKTKELCCGGRDKASPLFQPLIMEGQTVEQVQIFRYLGTKMDTSLSFSQQTDLIFKKAQQRLHLLRKLRTFQVSKDILTLVYRSLIESVLTFNISSWYNQHSIKHKTRLTRIVNKAVKITGSPQPSLPELYSRAVIRKANLIIEDPSQPLHNSLQCTTGQEKYLQEILYPLCNSLVKQRKMNISSRPTNIWVLSCLMWV